MRECGRTVRAHERLLGEPAEVLALLRVVAADDDGRRGETVGLDGCRREKVTRRISSRLDKEGEGQVEEREDAPVWMPVQPYASSSETSDDDMTESPAPPYCVRYEGEREPSNSHRQPELRRSAAPVAEDEAKPTHLLGDVDVEQALGVRLLDDLPRVLRGREESAQA